MKYLLLLLLLPVMAYGEPGDRADFLNSWELMQSSNDAVKSFEKVSDSEYEIEFRHIPYKGKLVLLTYNVEALQSYGLSTDFTATGYVEIDLPGELDNLMQKYSRSYFSWAENNTLQFNAKTSKWVGPKEYAASFQSNGGSVADQMIAGLFEFWAYALIAIIIYFVWSTFVNNKRVKHSLLIQEQAFVKSIAISEQSIAYQKEAIETGREAHQQTNALLKEILASLKKS